MEFYGEDGFDIASLKGKTLIMPSPQNVGNISQLAVDLLLLNGGFKRVGSLLTQRVQSAIGNDSHQTVLAGSLQTSFEVYYNNGNHAVIQLRSPTIKGQGALFSKELVQWIQSVSFTETIVLSGADASRRSDQLIKSPSQLRYLSPLKLKPSALSNQFDVLPLEEPTAQPFPTGSGLCKFIYDQLIEARIPTLVLFLFTADGYNVQDAGCLASVANQLAAVVSKDAKWSIPFAWREIMATSEVTRSLYQ
ncbi:Proteasome assembly chaperone 2 [Chytridiales sp. JEL 0842]|nr:Proteasome assembly chaperone 2 [Chytridiales sp. JEL 0842]